MKYTSLTVSILSKIRFRIESLIELTFCKALIVTLPFRFWSRICGTAHCETLREEVPISREVLRRIEFSVEWASRWVPWPSRCLDRALATQRMLARRRLPTTIYFGMLKKDLCEWTAHAWVRCGDRWVMGYQGNQKYTVVGTFARIHA